MKILVIDPVTTQWPGDLEYFENVAEEGTEVEILSLEKGPSSVETYHDAVYAGPEVLRLVREKGQKADAIMIHCFADVGVEAAREISSRPVLGPGETSMAVATLLGATFSVISPLKYSTHLIRPKAEKMGVAGKLASVVDLDIPVLSLLGESDKTIEAVLAGAKKAIEHDGAEVIILGCTAMATISSQIKEKLDVPLIEPAATTLKMAEAFVRLGLRHDAYNRGSLASFSKITGY